MCGPLPVWSHLLGAPLFLFKVQSFGERIVLFVLNAIVFGRLERRLDSDDMFFLPHPAKEQAKILWRDGAAVGFYSIKMKGEGHMACEVEGEWAFRVSVHLCRPPLGTGILWSLLAWDSQLITLSCKSTQGMDFIFTSL